MQKMINKHHENQLRSEIRGALARSYCDLANNHKTIDVDLIQSMENEMIKLIRYLYPHSIIKD